MVLLFMRRMVNLFVNFLVVMCGFICQFYMIVMICMPKCNDMEGSGKIVKVFRSLIFMMVVVLLSISVFVFNYYELEEVGEIEVDVLFIESVDLEYFL